MAKGKPENAPSSLSPGASTPITSSVPSTPAAGSTPTPSPAASPAPTPSPAPSPVDGNPLLIDENKEKDEKRKKEEEEAAAAKNLKPQNATNKTSDNTGGDLLMQHLVEQAQRASDNHKANSSLSTFKGSADAITKGFDKIKSFFSSKDGKPDPASNLSPASDSVGTPADLAGNIPDGASPKPDGNTPSPTPPAADVADVPDPSKLGLS